MKEVREVRNLFEAILEGSAFWYKQTLFVLLNITYSVREFAGYQIFEDDRTIALVKRHWIYANGGLRMLKDKSSIIFSKKTLSLYHRRVYKDKEGNWKKAFYGVPFSKVEDELLTTRRSIIKEFTDRVAKAADIGIIVHKDTDGGELASILLALRVGERVTTRDEMDAMSDHKYNKVPLRTIYRRLKRAYKEE